MRLALVHPVHTELVAIKQAVLSLPGCSIAWMTRDPAEVLALCRKERPDLLLLDVQIAQPALADLTRQIMNQTPCPILITARAPDLEAGRIFEAMGRGAIDAVCAPLPQPGGGMTDPAPLLRKIRTLAPLATGRALPGERAFPPDAPKSTGVEKLIVMGVSTGGPMTLTRLLGGIHTSPRLAFVVIQHIDERFAGGLVNWLGGQIPWKVRPALEGERPAPGVVHLAMSNGHLVAGDAPGTFRYRHEPADCPYRPSVNVYFESLAVSGHPPGVAILLTGMGDDGATGLLKLRRAGWTTIAQDRATSVIYGMPRAAAELDAADRILSLPDIAAYLDAL